MKNLNCIKDQKIRDSFYRKLSKYLVKSENENDCWKWNGQKSSHGYPLVFLSRKLQNFRVSRLLLNEVHPMPNDRTNALHTCDNPECTNPKHLFWGTHKENMQDCKNKKRTHIPNINRDITSRCNIKTKDIEDIYVLANTKNITEIANIYNVNKMTIWRILKKANIRCVDMRLSKNKTK